MQPLTLLELAVSLGFFLLFLVSLFQKEMDRAVKLGSLVAFIAWGAYAAYEGIYIREWLTDISGAPIRVDLLFFGPILAVITHFAIAYLKTDSAPQKLESGGLAGQRVCECCGHVGPMKTWLRSYTAPKMYAFILYAMFMVPGILFTLFYWGKFVCPKCGEVGRNHPA